MLRSVCALFTLHTLCLALPDWLLHTPDSFPAAQVTSQDNQIMLSNGLIERTFTRAESSLGCTSFRSLLGAGPPTEILRMVSPEAMVTLDGTPYAVGGLVSTDSTNCTMDACCDAAHRGIFTDHATRNALNPDPNAFQFDTHTVGTPVAPFEWTPGTRYAPKDVSWPPDGVSLELRFKAPPSAPAEHQTLQITIRYELYRGVPIMSKSLTIANTNSSAKPVQISDLTIEYLAVTGPYSPLPLIPYPPASRTSNSAGAHDTYGGTEPFSGLLWVEKDQPHAAIVSWQDDKLVAGGGG